MDDIAIVGIGLRFPGEPTSPEELWKVLERGESQWSKFPEDRLNIDGYFHPSGDRQGSISFRGAHFLKGDIAAFESPFFSIAAEDAKAIDPQQRMLLEVSYEALENAGLRKEDLDGSDTAVYVGSFVKDYEQIYLRDPDWQPRYAATGNGIAIMANRISHYFNFHGPSMTIDTGCSGSLVSIHLAAQSLRSDESSLAIAAGSGMILTPNTIMPMTALNFLSPDGKCFTFDSRANGYGRGEGIGVLVMKRLSDALRDNDTIRTVIRGSAVNQDGRTPGITLSSKEAQVANIRSVYAAAGLDFGQTAYVECHGTGTQAGDWRELKAISETLGSVRPVERPIVVGSIKPNIGHLEGAAGVAGMIKGILMLERAQIPPNINFEKENPEIDFKGWRVTVPRSIMQWPLSGTRRVSINCFGFGGTNAHVILDEAPAYLSARGLYGNHNSVDQAAASGFQVAAPEGKESLLDVPQLFCYSSHEKSGVLRIMEAHVTFLEARNNRPCPAHYLRDYAYTLACRRSNLEWKGFVVANSLADLVTKTRGISEATFVRTCRDKKPRMAFIFCGQGAQWAQMGRDLMIFEAFRLSLEAGRHMTVALQSPFDLVSEILRSERETCLVEAHISQPATTAIQVALVDLLRSLGIVPRHVVGHSSGEIAAAYAAGALSKQQAWMVAYQRGVAVARIRARAPKLRGGMMVVGMSEAETEAYLEAVGLSVQIACVNSPRSMTISGQAEAIELMERELRGKGVSQPRCLSDLPQYAWNHSKSYWHESHLSVANRFRKHGRQDLIGAPTADSVPFEPQWRGFLHVAERPWIQDHQVQKTMVYPAAGMVSMVLEGARQMSAAAAIEVVGYEIGQIQIEKAIVIPKTAHGLEVALNIKERQGRPVEFAIYSKALDHGWERNAQGVLRFRTARDGWAALLETYDGRLEALERTCTEAVDARQLYEQLDTVGMNYGPLFQNMTHIGRGERACVCTVRVPDTRARMPVKFEYAHLLHPATLDSMFQTLFALEASPMVPTSTESIFVSAETADGGTSPFRGYAVAERSGIRDADACIVMRRAGGGRGRVIVEGLHLTGLATRSAAADGFLPNHRSLCTEITWKEDAAFATPKGYSEQVTLLAHKYPALAVLQVGGGPGPALDTLKMVAPDADGTPRLARYTLVERRGIDDGRRVRAGITGTRLEHLVEIKENGSALAGDYHLILAFGDAGVVDPARSVRRDGADCHLVVRLRPRRLGRLFGLRLDRGRL